METAVHFASFQAFWSPDCGVRFAMIRSLLEHGSLIHWNYAAGAADPVGQIHPIAFFLLHRANDFVPQYEPLFPFLSAVPYKLFGFYGLAIIPVVSGIFTVVFLYKSALRLRLSVAPYMPIAAGIGTPIIVYSVVFWDHAIMMLCVSAASYFMLIGMQEDEPRRLALAGAVLGFGVFIHELVMAAFLAILIGSLPLVLKNSGRRMVVALLAGFAPILVVWLACNQAIYGNAAGAHLSENMSANTADHPFDVSQILNLNDLLDRTQQELTGTMHTGIMLAGRPLDLPNLFIVFAALLTSYAAIAAVFGAHFKQFPILWLASAVIAVYLVNQTRWAHGLFEATPLFIPGIAASWIAESRDGRSVGVSGELSKESIFIAWLSRSSWIFIILGIVDPILPGTDWGSRYLLTVLPFLVLLSAYIMDRQYAVSPPSWRPAAAGCMILLVGMSVYCQAEGLVMIEHNIRYNRDVNRRLSTLASPVIVSSDVGLGAEASAIHLAKEQFLVRGPDDYITFRKAMRLLNSSVFTMIGSKQDCANLLDWAAEAPDDGSTIKCTGRAYFHTNPDDEDGWSRVLATYAIAPYRRPGSLK
jgi:hypothetical protein